MDDLGAITETGGAAAAELAVAALLERGGRVGPCANCGAPVTGPYCAACGQPTDTHRRSVLHLFHDLVKDIASFDSRILRTAGALLFEPGELPLAFRHGRTQRYVPPVRLYLFVSLLFFLFLSATGIAFVQLGIRYQVLQFTHDRAGHVFKIENGKPTLVKGLRSDAKGYITISDPGIPGITLPAVKANGDLNYFIGNQAVFFRRPGDVNLALPPAARAKLEKIKTASFQKSMNKSWFERGIFNAMTKLETDPAALNAPLMAWIPRILFILLPMFGLLLAAFYWRRRREFYFVDHLVFSLTVHTFAFIVLVVAALAAQVADGRLVTVLTVGALSTYLLLSLKRFYGERWLATGMKFTGIAVIYGVFFLFPALTIAVVASMLYD